MRCLGGGNDIARISSPFHHAKVIRFRLHIYAQSPFKQRNLLSVFQTIYSLSKFRLSNYDEPKFDHIPLRK